MNSAVTLTNVLIKETEISLLNAYKYNELVSAVITALN